MKLNFGRFLWKNKVDIVSITLAMVSIVLAVYIFDKSKEISDKTDRALAEIKSTSAGIKSTTDGVKLLLQPMVDSILNAMDPLKELTQQDRKMIELYDLLNDNPQTEENWLIKGFTAQNETRYNDAIKYYKKAIEINPNFVVAYNNLADVYIVGKKDYDKAIIWCKKAIAIDPNLAITYCTLGEAYQEKGDQEKTIESFKQAAKLGYEPSQQLLRDKGITW